MPPWISYSEWVVWIASGSEEQGLKGSGAGDRADGGLGRRGAVIRMLCGRRVGICALTSSAHKGMEE